MAPLQPSQRLSAFLVLFCFLNPVHSDSGLNTSMNYANLSEAFPPLAALYTTHLKKSPYLGGQNFTQCCLKAVNLSYVIQNGQPIQNPNPALDFLNFPPNSLDQGQFPCGAAYTGDPNGAEPVMIPYSWCKQNCAGWEQSSNTALSQWVQPFVGFILPAAVFCLNVPRKSVFGIPDGFFQDHFADMGDNWKELLDEWAPIVAGVLGCFHATIPGWIEERTSDPESSHNTAKAIGKFIVFFVMVFVDSFVLICRAASAAAIGLINTMIWVAVVFSTAGPMIMSGLYEASLYRKIIRSILEELKSEKEKAKNEGHESKGEIKTKEQQTIFYKRIHQLYAVLVGNLKLPRTREGIPEPPRTVWEDVNNLVKAPGLLAKLTKHANPSTEEHVRPKPKEQVLVTSEDHVELEGDEQISFHSEYRKITETRLKGMLGCQASFGAAVGAPVVFFVGSFLFGVISNLTVVGDNDTAHALAFGQWWMTIPHVAIVSGCLLAGNNPNTLEVIVSSLPNGPWEERDPPKSKFRKVYQPFYSSVYLPVEMWARGRTKRAWIDKLLDTYGPSFPSTDVEGNGKHTKGKSKEGEFHLTLMDWVVLVAITLSLMGLPFVLAFLTSYYTPAVGLSCRTLTFLLYFVFQICFGIVWVSDFFFRFHRTQHIQWLPFAFREEVEMNRDGNGKEKEKAGGEKNGSADVRKLVKRRNAPTWFGLLLAFLVLGSLFTTVVGTFLQILGVYRNCLCDIPIGRWYSGDFTLAISTNTKDDIYFATKFWLPTGVASIILLIVVCYIGWWYQRHWRSQFRDVVQQLLYPELPKEPKPKAETKNRRGRNARKNTTPGDTTNDPTKGVLAAVKTSMDDTPAATASTEKKQPQDTVTENKGDEIIQG